jgi:hypothetical protein
MIGQLMRRSTARVLTVVVSRESCDGIAERALIQFDDKSEVAFLFADRLSTTRGLSFTLQKGKKGVI